MGGKADAYPEIENEENLMRIILRELQIQNRPYCINTKSDLVCRDIDIISKHENHCDVYMSICTLDDEAIKYFEPFAPPPSRRIEALKILLDFGIDANVDAAPWMPGISNAEKLIKTLPENINIQFSPLEIMNSGKSIIIR